MAGLVHFQALTVKAAGAANRIITDCTVSEPFDGQLPVAERPTGLAGRALWDTGATHSVISTELAQKLALPPVGVSKVFHGGGTSDSHRYVVNFLLPNRVGFAGVLVTEFVAPADQSFDVIFGMDVIAMGDLAITNVAGRTWMSFRTPSCETVDFVEVANRLKFAGVTPNDPCPCGSGKKFKKCHRM
jgi:hypothetical protein